MRRRVVMVMMANSRTHRDGRASHDVHTSSAMRRMVMRSVVMMVAKQMVTLVMDGVCLGPQHGSRSEVAVSSLVASFPAQGLLLVAQMVGHDL